MESNTIKTSPFTGFYRHGECVLLQMRIDNPFRAILEALRLKPDNQELLKNAVTEFYLRYPFNRFNFDQYISNMLVRAENYLKEYHPEIDIKNPAPKPLPHNYFLNVLPNPTTTTINLSSPQFNPTIQQQESYDKFISAINLDNPSDNQSPHIKSYEITRGSNGTHNITGRGMRFNGQLNRNQQRQLLHAEATQLLNVPMPEQFAGSRGVLFVPYSAWIEYTPHNLYLADGVKNHADIEVPAGVYIVLTMVEYGLNGLKKNIVD